jgi:hypothetical protein
MRGEGGGVGELIGRRGAEGRYIEWWVVPGGGGREKREEREGKEGRKEKTLTWTPSSLPPLLALSFSLPLPLLFA